MRDTSLAPFTPTEMLEFHRLVAGLAQGWTDRAAARDLNVSLRTFERRVGQLSSALGATSRFQLGCLCAHHGLLVVGGDLPAVRLPQALAALADWQ